MTQLVCNKSHALLLHRAQALHWLQLFRQPAEAGPAACLAASCGGKGCSSRMLWQGAMADVLGSLPQRIYFIRQEPAEVVGVVLV